MSRWGKNIVVPLDSLCKEKENTNRPTVARSVGTVGKWGKMGFTSTRTYTLSALPAAVAAAAAAAAASPAQSPASALDDDMSPSVPEPPKPKKFFKSRNTAPPEVIAQIIQQFPRAPTSPTGADHNSLSIPGTPMSGCEPIKLKIPKNSAERKKKSSKKSMKVSEEIVEVSPKVVSEPKPKKKKEEKKLKPEAPPSRVTSRARKTVNYCEDDEDERIPTPLKDIIMPKSKTTKAENTEELPIVDAIKVPTTETDSDPVLPPPAAPAISTFTNSTTYPAALGTPTSTPKTPEHPPIVLRISKGTSRLVSTDSEEHPNTSSPTHDAVEVKSRVVSSIEEVPAVTAPTVIPTTPKIIVKPPKPPSPEPTSALLSESNEINYCTVKISPDKPPKERLKLIIKTDFIRKAAAEKSALADAKTLTVVSVDTGERPEKEKKQKSKKHKHLKHAIVEQLTPVGAAGTEFKTPSPHLALGNSIEQQQALARTVISPPALSEKDFDSQSSVLGSISSKGNSTPSQPLAQTVQEESCVIHSRGSSVITSDLETSQHSSLVAPPSDIESRLESMMMDGGEMNSQRTTNLVEEPLQEDILAVLRGDESQTQAPVEEHKMNGNIDKESIQAIESKDITQRRVTRGRTRGAMKSYVDDDEEMASAATTLATSPKAQKTRGRKVVAAEPQIVQSSPEENTISSLKRTTRRGAKKIEDVTPETMQENETNSKGLATEVTNKTDEDETSSPTQRKTNVSPPVTRRGRPPRNAATTNNNFTNNNNNINKIAASLSAKAGAAEEAKASNANTPLTTINQHPIQRSYGRKRKNQQVTQVLQPSAEELEGHPTGAKLAHIDSPATGGVVAPYSHSSLPTTQRQTPTLDLHDSNSNSNSLTRPPSTTPSSPPRRDYKIKDKFKRTLTLDNQVNCNAVIASPTAQLSYDPATGAPLEEEQQRGSVKLVISKKKGSIFKSRALVPSDQSEQAANAKRHLYKHRWDAEANGGTGDDANALPGAKEPTQTNASARNNAADAVFDDFNDDLCPPSGATATRDNNSPALGKFTRVIKANPQAAPSTADVVTDTVNSTITRVRNVKSAHQIQEIGEYQEMDDDVEYILDALQPHNPISTRCLSALQLATKCMTPAFRMHVRAHGVVTKFFKALSDANKDLSLGLCTSAIMYILSQEGLNMDLDRDSLELMINLLEAEDVAATSDRSSYERNRQKVRELCEEIKTQGKGTHLNVDSITMGTLAMETLLSLTSKRAGDWFKEDLRELGGLEHIIKTISDSCRSVISENESVDWTHFLLESMQTAARCLRVLENVTQMNEVNQKYILTFANGAAIDTLCSLYRVCDRELKLHPSTESTNKTETGNVLLKLLIPLLKVLINLTHTFNPSTAIGAELLGQRRDVIDISFHLLLQGPNYIPDRCVFELSILVLLFLTNLSMYTIPNRALIMKAFAPSDCTTQNATEEHKRTTAIQAVMEYFYKCEELARLAEKNTDAILDNTDKNKKKQEEVDETINNLLQKAGHHMEHSMKGSYAALLIGHLIIDSEEYENIVRTHLRGTRFKEIVNMLEKYHTFMNLTASSEASVVAHIKSTKKIIDYFKKRDLVYDSGLPLNLETHHTRTSNDIASSSSSSSSSGGGSSADTNTHLASSAVMATTSTTATATASTPTTRSSVQRVYKTYSQR